MGEYGLKYIPHHFVVSNEGKLDMNFDSPNPGLHEPPQQVSWLAVWASTLPCPPRGGVRSCSLPVKEQTEDTHGCRSTRNTNGGVESYICGHLCGCCYHSH